MAVRRGGDKAGTGWQPRMAGLVVCAFFVMGVITGFSATGRAVTLRTANTLKTYRDRVLDSVGPIRDGAQWCYRELQDFAERLRGEHRAPEKDSSIAASHRIGADDSSRAIALVSRHDGFYALFDGGELRGPVSPAHQSDLPILSGAAIENARGAQMIDYATTLVRAETQLSELISEMRIADDGTASLFLEHARTELVIDLDRAPIEIQRAVEVRRKWQHRESLIAGLDMTTPDQAVVRLHAPDAPQPKRAPRKIIARSSKSNPVQESVVR
ncbi:MAG: hypothetical protein Q7S58_08500 [Candidatus Binatus sp.]|uniref:hypothetical protein n=1 Tax=Candidatus Binatus sp. TaxID=2811406 RepID=UPI00271E2E86|nr:hypothetical protein [Candidatus Binatus sp.]MDO8432432.1 hypothetical protein [Candidatus Binatus sp.]